MQSAKEMFEFARAKAKETFDKDGRHIPMFLIEGVDGTILPVGAPWRDRREKEATAIFLKHTARSVSAKRVAFVLESWMVVAKPGDDVDGVVPSAHPDRIEVIWIGVKTVVPGERELVGYWTITRSGRPRASAFVDIPSGGETHGIFDMILPAGMLQ